MVGRSNAGGWTEIDDARAAGRSAARPRVVGATDDAFLRVARAAIRGLADFCAIDVESGGGLLRAAAAWAAPFDGPDAAPVDGALRPGSAAARAFGLGQEVVYEELGAVHVSELAGDERQIAALRALGVREAAIVPLTLGGELVGALTLASATPGRPADRGSLVAPIIEAALLAVQTARLAEEARTAKAEAARSTAQLAAVEAQCERLAALADGGVQLGDSLDPEATVAQAVRVGVGAFADWCVLDVLDEAGCGARLAVFHKDESRLAAAEALARQPAESKGSRLMSVLEAGEPRLLLGIDARELERAIPDGQTRSLVESLGVSSAIQVPLVARGRGLGVLTFVRDGSSLPFGPKEIWFAREIGRRAALALDTARLYQQAVRAVGLREEFLSIAGHELRTPLTALTFQAQMLARTAAEASPEKMKERIDKVVRHAARLAALVDDLLDVARVTGGRLRLEREDVDLVRLVEEVIARFTDDPAHGGVEVRLQAGESAWGLWDRMRLEQVVVNLLTNALKYGQGKPIEIALVAREQAVVLRVRDHGIGIAAEDHARIFGRFERAVPSRHFGGFGLGLWIVRQVVEAHGGTIQVDSQPGDGASFRVELPREPAPDVVTRANGERSQ